MTDVKKFSPGSPEAIDIGCKCPIMDNRHGAGAYFGENNEPIFWFNLDCPLHGGAKQIDPKTKLSEEKK